MAEIPHYPSQVGPSRSQRILNAREARPCRSRPALECMARVVWEQDGEEYLRGKAIRYDRRDNALFVQLDDPRCEITGAWLPRSDVIVCVG